MAKPGLPYLDIIKNIKDSLSSVFSSVWRVYFIKHGRNKLISDEVILESNGF